jgi:hypothetical protein
MLGGFRGYANQASVDALSSQITKLTNQAATQDALVALGVQTKDALTQSEDKLLGCNAEFGRILGGNYPLTLPSQR